MNKYLIIVLMLSGCMTPLHKPGTSQQEVAKDNRECNFMGMQYAQSLGFQGNILVAADYQRGCLRDRGYN